MPNAVSSATFIFHLPNLGRLNVVREFLPVYYEAQRVYSS